MEDELRGTLRDGEPHPSAVKAFEFVKSLSPKDLMQWRESFASCAIEGNRLAEVCGETLDRILNGKPVSDQYVLGLAWCLLSICHILREQDTD